MVELRTIENAFSVTVSREFEHSIDKVFDAWLDPVGVGNWLFSTPDGKNKICEVDPRVGGDFSIGEEREDGFANHVGTYHVIDRPNKILFSYYQEGANEDAPSNVTVQFSETDKGCMVTVIHEMDGIYEEYEELAKWGWNTIFDGLGNILP